MTITFKVVKNEIFGDYRVAKFLNGNWVNERDNNFTESKARKEAKMYRDLTKKGVPTMTDNF